MKSSNNDQREQLTGMRPTKDATTLKVQALIDALQASPCRETDIAPARTQMPVRDACTQDGEA